MTTYQTIDDLQATTPDGSELLEVSQSGTSRRVTLDQVSAMVAQSDQVADAIDVAIAAIPAAPPTDWSTITGIPDFGAEFVNTAGDTMTGDLFVGDNVGTWEGVALEAAGWVSAWSDNSGYPAFSLHKTNNPANQQQWQITLSPSGALESSALDDGWTPQKTWSYARDGSTTLPGPATATWLVTKADTWPGVEWYASGAPSGGRAWYMTIDPADTTRMRLQASLDDGSATLAEWAFYRNGTTTLPGTTTTKGNAIVSTTGSVGSGADGVNIWPGGWIDIVGPDNDWAAFGIINRGAAANNRFWALGAKADGSFHIDAGDDAGAVLKSWVFNHSGSTVLPGPLNGTTATFSDVAATASLAVPQINLGSGGTNTYLRHNTAQFQIVNNAYSAVLFAMTDSGAATFSGALTGTTATFTTSVDTGALNLTGLLTGAQALFSGNVSTVGNLAVRTSSAVAAGSNTQAFIKASATANLGIYYGTGAPSFSAAKGSMYSNTTATTTTTRLYVNTDGATTWASLTTSA